MEASRRIAQILGPVLVVLPVTEGANLAAFAGNPAPVVYLNGTLLFAAGVAILQAHGRWVLAWPVLVTLSGWAMVLAGLYRMAMPAAPQAAPGAATDAVLVILTAAGLALSWQGYRRPG